MKLINLFVLIFVSLNLIYLSNSQPLKCDTCLAEGEKCMTRTGVSSDDYKDEQICSSGYVCGQPHYNAKKEDYVCMKLFEKDKRCWNRDDLCDVGLQCSGQFGFCKYYGYVMNGNQCKVDIDCRSSTAFCVNGTCQGYDNRCDFYNYECPENLRCDYNQHQCLPKLSLGEGSCKEDSDCVDGLYCSPYDSNYKRYCKYPPAIKQLGDNCTVSTQCDQTNAGLYCSPFSNKCEKYEVVSLTNCNSSGKADIRSCDEYHTCSLCDGKCYQSSLLPTQYLEYKQPLLDCVAKNCPSFPLNPRSSESPGNCITKMCHAEYCNSLRGVNTVNNPRACQRIYHVNTYCNGKSTSNSSNSSSNSTNSSSSSNSSNSSSKLSISIISLIVLVFTILLIK